jgi:hypothetical protein
MAYTLTTSWIPGEDRKGRFRYKLDAYPEAEKTYPAPNTLENLLKTDDCVIFLILRDAGDFELRNIPVSFGDVVDEDQKRIKISANESVPMSADEYKSFVGSPSHSGRWLIGWKCKDTP